MSRILRNKLRNHGDIQTDSNRDNSFNHDKYIERNFWGYVKNVLNKEDTVFPSFSMTECAVYFTKTLAAAEEVGQTIRLTSRPIRLRHFPHARTKLLASKIYIGLINIYFFHIVMQIFWKISRDTTFTTVNLPIGTVS